MKSNDNTSSFHPPRCFVDWYRRARGFFSPHDDINAIMRYRHSQGYTDYTRLENALADTQSSGRHGAKALFDLLSKGADPDQRADKTKPYSCWRNAIVGTANLPQLLLFIHSSTPEIAQKLHIRERHNSSLVEEKTKALITFEKTARVTVEHETQDARYALDKLLTDTFLGEDKNSPSVQIEPDTLARGLLQYAQHWHRLFLLAESAVDKVSPKIQAAIAEHFRETMLHYTKHALIVLGAPSANALPQTLRAAQGHKSTLGEIYLAALPTLSNELAKEYRDLFEAYVTPRQRPTQAL